MFPTPPRSAFRPLLDTARPRLRFGSMTIRQRKSPGGEAGLKVTIAGLQVEGREPMADQVGASHRADQDEEKQRPEPRQNIADDLHDLMENEVDRHHEPDRLGDRFPLGPANGPNRLVVEKAVAG